MDNSFLTLDCSSFKTFLVIFNRPFSSNHESFSLIFKRDFSKIHAAFKVTKPLQSLTFTVGHYMWLIVIKTSSDHFFLENYSKDLFFHK